MARPDTWMPLYWRDLWADTGHLSPTEGWAYINLIGAYWTTGGPLPNDDARLQRWAKVSSKEWRTVKDTVIGFFNCDNNCLRHSRIDSELERAKTAYDKRRAHIDKVNSHRTQSLSTVTVTVTDTQPQPHSTNVEPSAYADGGRKRPPTRATALPADWVPSERNLSDAADRGYQPADIDRIANHFRDHHRAKGTTSKDWNASWRTWLANEKRFASKGYGGSQPGPNRPGAGSVVDAVARLKAKARGESDLPGRGVHGGNSGFPTARGEPGDAGKGAANGGEIIDADDAERMFGAARGDETQHDLPAGAGARFGGPTGPVCAQTSGVPGGRGEESPDDTAEPEQMVAGMGGTERAAGCVLGAPPQASAGDDDLEIPAFLDRRAVRALQGA